MSGHVVLWGGRRGDWQLGSPRDRLELTEVTLRLYGLPLMVNPALGDLIGVVSRDSPALFVNSRTDELLEVTWAGRFERGAQQLRVRRPDARAS